MSTVFDSDLALVSPEDFDAIVMSEVPLFDERQYERVHSELDTWDTTSLVEIRDSVLSFLTERNGARLGLAQNIILDHCVIEGRIDHFRAYLLTNLLEWMIFTRQHPKGSFATEGQEEEE
jgi:hypothetical protein